MFLSDADKAYLAQSDLEKKMDEQPAVFGEVLLANNSSAYDNKLTSNGILPLHKQVAFAHKLDMDNPIVITQHPDEKTWDLMLRAQEWFQETIDGAKWYDRKVNPDRYLKPLPMDLLNRRFRAELLYLDGKEANEDPVFTDYCNFQVDNGTNAMPHSIRLFDRRNGLLMWHKVDEFENGLFDMAKAYFERANTVMQEELKEYGCHPAPYPADTPEPRDYGHLGRSIF